MTPKADDIRELVSGYKVSTADAYFAQRAAQEALSILKANEPQIKQLHAKLEDES